jgi:hypothetical protein
MGYLSKTGVEWGRWCQRFCSVCIVIKQNGIPICKDEEYSTIWQEFGKLGGLWGSLVAARNGRFTTYRVFQCENLKAKAPRERSVGHQVKPGMLHTISLIELKLSGRLERHCQGRFAGSIQVAFSS